MFITLEDDQYIGGVQDIWGHHEYIRGYHDYIGRYHEYIGGMFSASGECSVHRGFHYKSKTFMNLLPHITPDVLNIPGVFKYPPDVLLGTPPMH